jgi:glycosyltransferase involved in cell wall biosynthesis
VLTGADEEVFRVAEPVDRSDTEFSVVYYGSFIKTHGVLVIVEAARLLSDCADVRFKLVGSGPMRSDAIALAESYRLENVEFVDWVPQSRLVEMMYKADVCLGVFGTTPQADMTMQNKIYEALALGKPLLTGDGSEVRRWLEHGTDVYLCEMDNPTSLTEALLYLKSHPDFRARLSRNARHTFEAKFSTEVLGRQYREHLEGILGVA